MIRLKFFIFGLFISFEFLIIVLITCLSLLFYDYAIIIGDLIRGNQEVLKLLLGFLTALTASVFALSSKIRAPNEKSTNRVLYNWEMYPLLRDRVYISFIYVVFSSLIGVSIFLFLSILSSLLICILSLTSTIVACITTFSIFIAHQEIREIIEKYHE